MLSIKVLFCVSSIEEGILLPSLIINLLIELLLIYNSLYSINNLISCECTKEEYNEGV